MERADIFAFVITVNESNERTRPSNVGRDEVPNVGNRWDQIENDGTIEKSYTLVRESADRTKCGYDFITRNDPTTRDNAD